MVHECLQEEDIKSGIGRRCATIDLQSKYLQRYVRTNNMPAARMAKKTIDKMFDELEVLYLQKPEGFKADED